jgi:hypothetical protein
MAAPMPLLPPVTTALRPLTPSVSVTLHNLAEGPAPRHYDIQCLRD